MATIKTSMGITKLSDISSLSASNTGAALSSYSGAPSGMNITPSLSTTDLILDSKYALFSFPLSREWHERMNFTNPKIFLTIQGRDVDDNIRLKRIWAGKEKGNYIICDWDNYFGILRILVPIGDIKQFNYITFVGVIMTRQLNHDDATGRIYKIGLHNDNLDTNFISTLKDNLSFNVINLTNADGTATIHNISTLSKLSGATQYPVTQTQDISAGKVAVAPVTSKRAMFTITGGYSEDEDEIRNSRFFRDQVLITFDKVTIGGESKYLDEVAIDDGEYDEVPSSCVIKIPNATIRYSPSVTFRHGGYVYTQKTDDYSWKELKRDTNFLTFDTEEEMFEFFDFTGERYRTKFEEYTDTNTLTLQTSIINGELKQRVLTSSPYQTTDNKSINLPFTTSDEQAASSIITISINSETPNKPAHYYTTTTTLYNIFTKEPEPITVQIPLIDQHKYYFLGDFFKVEYPNNSQSNWSQREKREVVVYDGATLLDHFASENSKVFDLDNFQFDDSIAKTWDSCRSYVPLEESEISFQNGVTYTDTWNKSYFEYRKPKIQKTIQDQSVDIIEEVYCYRDLKPWTILYCRSFNNITKPITNLKIQDGKLYYKIDSDGFGDKNEKFSVNQFINYAINGKHFIGLSSFDKNKQLTIYVPTNYIPNNTSEEEWYPVKTFGTGANDDSAEILKLFYTGIEQTIDAPDISNLQIPDTGLPLRLVYKDIQEYTIFDLEIGNAQVVRGVRPLGLRQKGIIVNPIDVNEELPAGTAEKIHLTLNDSDTTGKAIDISVHNNAGGELGTCSVEFKKGGNGVTQGFYFNGVNVSELNTTVSNSTTGLVKKVGDLETTVGNSSSGLVKDVNNIKNEISGLNFETIFAESSSISTSGSKGMDTYGSTITIPKSQLTNKLITNCQLSLKYISGHEDSFWANTIDYYFLDVGTPYITSCAKNNNGDLEIKFSGDIYRRSSNTNTVSFKVKAAVMYIELPSF